MQRAKGFTLIEMLIVVVIAAILLRIAIPQYFTYIQRGNVVAGTQALTQYRVQMEQYYQDNHFYTTTAATAVCGVALPVVPNFVITCAGDTGAGDTTGQTYTATATAAAGSNIAGAIYTIDQNNNQQTVGIPAAWGTLSGTASSWIVK